LLGGRGGRLHMVTDVCDSDNTTMEMISEIAKIRRNEKWGVPRVSWRAERTHQVQPIIIDGSMQKRNGAGDL
jgi:hypothetical protein